MAAFNKGTTEKIGQKVQVVCTAALTADRVVEVSDFYLEPRVQVTKTDKEMLYAPPEVCVARPPVHLPIWPPAC